MPTEPTPVFSKTIVILGCMLALLPAGYMTAKLRDPGPQAPNAAAQDASDRLNLSLRYINAGEPGKAREVLTDLVATYPGNAAAWNNLCVARTLLRELKDAEEACSRALSIDPAYELAKNNLKWAQDEIRSERDALAKMQKTPGAHHAGYFVTEGVHFLATGDYAEAIAAWRRALTQDPRNAIAANDIGVAYMFRKQPALAASWFRNAIAWDANMSLARNNLSWAEREQAKSGR